MLTAQLFSPQPRCSVRAEDLKARDLLDTDRECIASSGEMWRSFQVEAPWRQETCEARGGEGRWFEHQTLA